MWSKPLQQKRPLESGVDDSDDTSAEDDIVKLCVARQQQETLAQVMFCASAWMQQTSEHKYLAEIHDDIYAMVTQAAIISSKYHFWQTHEEPESTTTFRDLQKQTRMVTSKFTELKEQVKNIVEPIEKKGNASTTSSGEQNGGPQVIDESQEQDTQDPSQDTQDHSTPMMTQPLEVALENEIDREIALETILAEHEDPQEDTETQEQEDIE